MHSEYRRRVRRVVFSAVSGALYAALTILIEPLSYGPIQFRFAEALCLLPFWAPETTLGLFAGCLIANLFSPFGLPDIVAGSLATLLAVYVVSKMKIPWLTPLPVVLTNAVIVGAVISLYSEERIPFLWSALSVGFGELAVCVLLGLPLIYALPEIPYFKQLFAERMMEPSK